MIHWANNRSCCWKSKSNPRISWWASGGHSLEWGFTPCSPSCRGTSAINHFWVFSCICTSLHLLQLWPVFTILMLQSCCLFISHTSNRKCILWKLSSISISIAILCVKGINLWHNCIVRGFMGDWYFHVWHCYILQDSFTLVIPSVLCYCWIVCCVHFCLCHQPVRLSLCFQLVHSSVLNAQCLGYNVSSCILLSYNRQCWFFLKISKHSFYVTTL